MKPIRIALVLGGVALCAGAAPGESPRFAGWPVMHVIAQDGRPAQMRRVDLDADRREELLVVNVRQSRLELYRWLPADRRDAPPRADPDRPNELPMAPQFERIEIATERLPRDVLAANLDDDEALELVVLETPPNRIAVYDANADGHYEPTTHWDLLPGELAGGANLMLWQSRAKDSPTLLIRFNDGIQRLVLTDKQRPSWLEPREKTGRIAWWSADLDGDGDEDIVEWSRGEGQTVRWYESRDGELLPAAALSDLPTDAMELIATDDGAAQVLLLGGLQEGVLKRFGLETADAQPLGRRDPLPLTGADKAAWTGAVFDGKPALVVVDPDQPRVNVYWLTDAGWRAGPSFPIVSGVQAIAAPADQPGTILFRAKDGADLHQSQWDNGRLTYPRPMRQSENQPDRRILTLQTVGRTVWWVQRVGPHLDLYYRQPRDDGELRRVRFADVGQKIEQVAWVGNMQLLVLEKYARSPKRVVHAEGETIIREPAHLAKAKLDEFALVPAGDDPLDLKVARLSDGVLQWLDTELQPTDQVMLPDGLALADYVERPDGRALALESGGRKLHLLQPDDTGVMRVADSYDAHGGVALADDPALGLLLIDRGRVVRLADGPRRELQLIDSIDSRVGRPSGVKEATIHRMFTTDVTGDGQDEVVISDDRRHQLTVLQRTDDALKPLIGWPVYEDRAYPYGYGGENELVREPRAVVGLDFDNDGKQDLALLCHDRLLIYLGAKEDE